MLEKIKARVSEFSKNVPQFPFEVCHPLNTILMEECGTLLVQGRYLGPIDEAFLEKYKQINGTPFERGIHYFSYLPQEKRFFDPTAHAYDATLPLFYLLPEQCVSERNSEQATHLVERIFHLVDLPRVRYIDDIPPEQWPFR